MAHFFELFEASVRKVPDNVAVEMQRADTVESCTFAELHRNALTVGAWLEKNGVATGARCAIVAQNSPRWVAAYLGILARGAVAVPLDTAFNEGQITKLLRDSESILLFADRKNLERAAAAAKATGARLLALESSDGLPSLDSMFAAGHAGFTPARPAASDTAVMLYTSGTTADPRGVVLTHDNLLGESDSVFRLISVGPNDAILGVLPLFHSLAQMGNLLLPFVVGARVVYLETLNTNELLRALRERSITFFACVPQFFYLIHERITKEIAQRPAPLRALFPVILQTCAALRRIGLNPGKLLFRPLHALLGRRLKFLITGGSRFDIKVLRDLHAMGFNILQAYGLTECSGAATCTLPDHNVLGSVGPGLPGVDIRIVKNEQEGESQDGEVLIRGRIVMQGYWKRPDANAATLRDGWLHTGDLGYVDDGGNLFITGRAKEIIVLSSGKNIYPEEIEAHYVRSPFVKEICVLGIAGRPDEPLSERLHGVVVPDFEVLKERKIVNTRELIRFELETLSSQLPPTKRILSFDIWPEPLPRTTTRKLKRFQIQKQLEELHRKAEEPQAPKELSADDAAWVDDPQVAKALDIIREAARRDHPVHPADNLELDLGLDSMERVELLVALEQALGASVPESAVSEVYTVRELVDAVRGGARSSARQSIGWDAVLATESDDPDVLSVVKPHRIATAFWFLMARMASLLARDIYHLRVEGLENLPRSGPFILSPNHQSFIEAPLVMGLIPWRIFKNTFYVGTSEVFGQGLLRRLGRTLRLVPVDPDSNLVNAMRAGAYGLKRGKVLVLYPEGERSIDGTPKVFKKGAAILSTHLQVPIVPVAVDGFYELWPRGKNWFQRWRGDTRVTFGAPLPPPSEPPSEQLYQQLTAELKRRVMVMWDEQERELHPQRSQAMAAD